MKRLSHFVNSQYLAFLLALLAIPMLLWLLQQSTAELVKSRAWVEHTYSVIVKLNKLRSDAVAVESSRIGYLVAKQDIYFAPYHQAVKNIPADILELEKLTADNSKQHERLVTLRPYLMELIAVAKNDIESKGTHSVSSEEMTRSKYLIDQVRSLIDQMTAEEDTLLAVRSEDSSIKVKALNAWLVAISLGFFALLGLAFWVGQREITKRRKAELSLLQSQGMTEVTVRNLSLIGEMTSLLQACSDTDESLDVICQYTARLLNTDSGVLYLFRESRNMVELSVSWGEESTSDPSFPPDNCWALRRGELHVLDHTTHSIACRHLHDWGSVCSVCIPIVAQGNVLGIMHLENKAPRQMSEEEIKLAQNLANQIALAMSSMKLRETLRNLSVRDPLTGLFNRRYMEESMQRELANAKRKNRSLGLVILDLDHFKEFNDTFGHDAGDMLLREVGALLSKNSRAGDIACRFGGEEFVIIFPEAELNIIIQLSDQLRTVILAMQLQHFGRSLRQVSASFGVAAYPEHGGSIDELLRAADKALYKAKAAGRNRVEVADVNIGIV